MFCVLRFAKNRIAYCVEVIKLILQFLNLITGLDVTNTKIDHHKGTVSRDFRLFFALNIRPGPLMNRPKQFRKLFVFAKTFNYKVLNSHVIVDTQLPEVTSNFQMLKMLLLDNAGYVNKLKYFISADCSFKFSERLSQFSICSMSA